MDAHQHYISMLQSDEEEERLHGLKGLASSGIEECVPVLYAALGDESWRVRKEAAEIFLALPRAGELAGEIIELLHSPENAGLRNTAAEILTALGRRAVPFLLEELSCTDRDVRKFVLDIMGEIGSPTAIPAMIAAIQDPDENVRAAAAENLGKLKAQQAVPALIEALERPELLFRFTVLEALGEIGAAVPAKSLLRFREERLLRKALMDCLGRIGGAEAIAVLAEGLTDRMRNVREAAALALARIGAERPGELEVGLEGVPPGPAAERIGEMLDSGSPDIRQAALQLIRYLGGGGYVSRLLAMLEEEELREDAARALISLAQADPAALIDKWAKADDRTRGYLAYLFGEAGCESSTDLLLSGLAGDDADLRSFSAQALGRLGHAKALPRLIAALGDPAPEVREATLRALLTLSPGNREETLRLLGPLLEDEDPEQRMYAVTLCGALDGPEAEGRLTLAFKDESPLVRGAAVRGFDGQVSSRHFSTLVLALTDEEAEVRRLAVELLGRAGDPQGRKPLELALQDEDPWVRAAAVRALGHLGGSTDWTEAALADPVGLVVIAALEVLAAKGGENGDFLLPVLSHPDEEVIRAGLHLLPDLADSGLIETVRDDLLHHSNREVRLSVIHLLAERMGRAARGPLQARLLVEGDEFLRRRIRDLLAEHE